MFALQSLLILLAAHFSPLYAKGPTVNLGYSTYEGISLPNGQNQFLGIRYAAPPLRNLRFRRPQPSVQTEGIQSAKESGPICFGVKGPFNPELPRQQSEDCLYLNIWAPSNVTKNTKLPVFFWIHGGGYTFDLDPNYNGSALVQATGNNMIYVNVNYRLGPYGFLASERVRKDGDLNVGLLDQRFALQWVQQHIGLFGGDSKRAVLVGDSAGAGSVALHMVAYGGRDDGLFVGGFGLSPYFPTQLRVSELEWQFDLFVKRTGCNHAQEALKVLK
ncbi:hypothetical protein M422DRAFT_265616 [Sphaerobolus stellatus SS14]|uniref:Carboxylesterase type B domain-containing protein n=1 Tax=Sphaerobolus stellatus (strain SS14) TaxID=990650 RepID=A0A0C9UTM5_SPHS4|nr:hypothetical protein M422DRAFT_265616 [Sphaerobolus stellatus SS14]